MSRPALQPPRAQDHVAVGDGLPSALRERPQEAAGRTVHFQLFEAYDLNDDNDETVSYASLATTFDLEPATVNNYLAATRRDFRRIVLDKLREITATDEEFRTEARSLLGVDVK